MLAISGESHTQITYLSISTQHIKKPTKFINMHKIMNGIYHINEYIITIDALLCSPLKCCWKWSLFKLYYTLFGCLHCFIPM